VEALREKERHDETQFTIKIVGKKLVWVPVSFFLVKLSFPVTSLMPSFSPLLAGLYE
jgi:hypothetical protein